MRGLALLASLVLAFASTVRTTHAQAFEHRWAGLIYDAFLGTDGQLWTVEDGGRIRHRTAAGARSYQSVPEEVKDTLGRVHFLSDNTTGWAVGHNGWILKTVNGGASWSILLQKASIGSPSTPEELTDVHFLDALTGWLVGIHGVWITTTGGATESAWSEVPLYAAGGAALDPSILELYAIDVVERQGGLLGLLVAEPGYILRSADPEATSFQVVWDIHDLCGSEFLEGCEKSICDSSAKYEPWDVEIRRVDPSEGDPLALVVGGIGVGCGYVVSSQDDGESWRRDLHECKVSGANCNGDSDYNDDDIPGSYEDTWRHKFFLTLYGVAILDGDGTAVAAGYNGQHVVRDVDGAWRDRSSFSTRPVEASTAIVYPLYGAVADGGTDSNGTAYLTGTGGHLRKTNNSEDGWQDELPGAPWRVSDVHFASANTGWQVGQFFRIAKTDSGGATWMPQEPLPVLGTTGLLAIAFEPSGSAGVTAGSFDTRLISSFQNKPKILWTDSGGGPPLPWQEALTISTIEGTNWDFKTLRDVEWVSGGVFWTVGESGLAFHTDDGGATWSQHADLANGIESFQKYEFEGVAFLDTNNGVIVGWKQNAPTGQALAYKKVGSVETWTNIGPSDPSITKIADVKILGTSAYAVGEKTSGGTRQGVILRSDYSGGEFGAFAPISPHPTIPACMVSGDLTRIPVLNEIAVNAANGDIWVGGECGRLWRYTSAGGWNELKSQTDGHVVGISLAGGYAYVQAYRMTNTQQVMTRSVP